MRRLITQFILKSFLLNRVNLFHHVNLLTTQHDTDHNNIPSIKIPFDTNIPLIKCTNKHTHTVREKKNMNKTYE